VDYVSSDISSLQDIEARFSEALKRIEEAADAPMTAEERKQFMLGVGVVDEKPFVAEMLSKKLNEGLPYLEGLISAMINEPRRANTISQVLDRIEDLKRAYPALKYKPSALSRETRISSESSSSNSHISSARRGSRAADAPFSAGGGGIQVPIGGVLAFAGDLSQMLNDCWLNCNGDLVSSVAYPELYALFGTKYGGDDNGNFKLPNWGGRTLVGSGQGEGGLTPRQLGDQGGEEAHPLTIAEMPNHAHSVNRHHHDQQNFDWKGGGGKFIRTTTEETVGTTAVGGNQPHNNMQPFAVVHWIIRVK